MNIVVLDSIQLVKLAIREEPKTWNSLKWSINIVLEFMPGLTMMEPVSTTVPQNKHNLPSHSFAHHDQYYQ